MRRLLLAGLVSACTLAAQPQAGAGSIEGHVLNSLTGEPLRKATVILTATQIRLVDNTDAAGKFHFTGLPPGTYRISASHAGFLDHAARRPIPLIADQDVADAEIQLPPQGVIAGRILDEDADPSPGATVSIFKQVYKEGRKQWRQLNGNAVANDAGEYRFAMLRPGRYILCARNQRETSYNRFGDRPTAVYSPFYPAYYPNTPSQQEAVPVEVGVGADVRDIDIHLIKRALPPFFHVRGKVAGAPGSSTISVSLQGGEDCSGSSAIIGPPDYAFDLTSGPGQCNIMATVDDGGPEAYGSLSVSITGDITGVVVSMTPAATVSGRISLAEGRGQVKLQGVSVALNNVPFYDNSQETRSDATGKLVFNKPIRPGHYSMKVVSRSIPDGWFIQDVKLGGQEISLDDFEVQGSAQLEFVLSNTAGTIKGSVSDADANPLPISTVTLIPTDGNSWPEKQSLDDNGNFQFAGLRPGKYDVFAWEEVDDDLWQDPDFRKKYGNRATEVTVGPRETQNVQLRVIPAEEMK